MTRVLDLTSRRRETSPSPDRYDIKSSIGNGPKASFGARTRSQLEKYQDSLPSPAAYNIRSHIGDVPQITMGGRVPLPSHDETPGPGAYSPSRPVPKNIPSLSGRREEQHRARSPDYYTLPSLVGNGRRITMGARTSFNDFSRVNPDTANVGPGSHSPALGYVRRGAAAFTMGTRHEAAR